MLQDNKQTIRERILTLLRNQKKEERLAKSSVIQTKLFNLQEFQKATSILFYASFDGEVETFEMIRQAQKLGKNILLPRIEEKGKKIFPTLCKSLEHLVEGPYGIKQPKEDGDKPLNYDNIDMIIVPGVAYDKNNNRLGRGAGYYDRFLQRIPSRITTIGLAFDFQIIDSLPDLNDQDIPVTKVLSN